MFYNDTVLIPLENSNVSLHKTSKTAYVEYTYDRVYDSKKKYAVPKRKTIGKVCTDDASKMYPNENFFIFFPSSNQPELSINEGLIISILNSSNTYEKKHENLRNLVRLNNNHPMARGIAMLSDLCIIHTMMLQYDEKWQPLNTYNVPTTEEKQFLKDCEQKTKDLFIKARIQEYLFYCKCGVNYLHSAIALYIQLIDDESFEYYDERNRLINSCLFMLARKGISSPLKNDILEKAENYVRKSESTPTYQDLFVLKGISRINFSLAEQILQDLVNPNNFAHPIEKNEHYLLALLELYQTEIKESKNSKDRSRTNQLTQKEHITKKSLAIYYEQLADTQSNNINKRSHLLNSLKRFEDVSKYFDVKKDIQRVKNKLEPIGVEIVRNLKEFRTESIDFTNDYQIIDNHFSKLSMKETLLSLIGLFKLHSLDSIKEHLKEINCLTYEFASTTVVNKAGQIICIVPPLCAEDPVKKENALIFHCAEYYQMALPVYIEHIIGIIREKFVLDNESIEFIINNNPLIPADRKTVFATGILAGFNGDFSIAIHLLVLQLENSIRHITAKHDINIYQCKNNGLMETLSPSTILEELKKRGIFDQSIVFNLKVFLYSEYGIGMRDKLAHALLDDSELNGDDAVLCWWFILKLLYSASNDFNP